MNRVILMGRLTSDPEIRNGVASYTLAVDRGKDNEADYIRCVGFQKTAEFIEKYLKKGTKILIEGRIRTGSYEDRETHKKIFTTDVVIDRHEFCEKRGEVTSSVVNIPDNIMQIPDGIQEELPFK